MPGETVKRRTARGKLSLLEKDVDVHAAVLEKLWLWARSGGSVRVANLAETEAVIELCACTGEMMERFSSSDGALLEQLASTEVDGWPEDAGALET